MQGKSFLKRFRDVLDRYRVHAYVAVAIFVTGALILSEVYPAISEHIYNPTLLAYLTLLIVIDVSATLAERRDQASTRISANQDESINDLIGSLTGCPNADLLEYAGATTLPLIRSMRRANIRMRILIKHPESVDGVQRQRTMATLDTLYNSALSGYEDRFELRCYRLPYSLRGRHICGRLLEIGWLTPDVGRRTAFGHANPSLLIELPDSRKNFLREFFDETFKTYWEHPETEDGHQVLERLSAP